MKRAWTAAAYVCGGAMGAAVGMWGAGWCPWLTCAMVLLGCGGGLFIALRELAALREHERRQAEAGAAQRMAGSVLSGVGQAVNVCVPGTRR